MEKVDYYLEQMLPELHDLKEKKLFDTEEIREIIKRRTAFERALIRRVARKQDFTRYAEYELNLEELRKKRLARKKNAHSKPSISSYSLVKRILYIFDRATKKFKGDIGLWIQYAEVAKKEGARKLVGKVLATALLQHPLSPSLYILLSSHELTVNLSPNSARTLLQRGLRLLPHSIPLWTEYAKMELVWVERLRRRWEILGVKDAELTAEEGSAEDQSEQGRKAIMDGAVVVAVWEGARKALPESLELHQSFLRLLRTFPTVLRAPLLEKLVYASLREEGSSLGRTAEGRTILAMRTFEDSEYPGEKKELEGKKLVDALKEMVDEFKKAGKELEGKEKDVVLERFAVALRNWEGKVEDDGLQRYLSHHLNQLLLPPNTTPRIHALHLTHLLSSSTPTLTPKKILSAARTSTSLFPNSPSVWSCRLTAELRYSSPEASDDLDAVMRQGADLGLAGMPSEEDEEELEGWESLWEVYFLYLSSSSTLSLADQTTEIHRLLQKSLRTPKSTTFTSASSTGSSSLPIHTHLLISSLPLLHPFTCPPTIPQRLATFQSFKTLYLPTPEFYSFAFTHESLLPTPRLVLEAIYNEWRSSFGISGGEGMMEKGVKEEEEVECHLTWLRWLNGVGEAKAVRECLRRLPGSNGVEGGEGIGARVEERWRVILDEEKEEDEEDEEDEREQEEDAEMSEEP